MGLENHPGAHAHVRLSSKKLYQKIIFRCGGESLTSLLTNLALVHCGEREELSQPIPAPGEETLRGQTATLPHCPVGTIRRRYAFGTPRHSMLEKMTLTAPSAPYITVNTTSSPAKLCTAMLFLLNPGWSLEYM